MCRVTEGQQLTKRHPKPHCKCVRAKPRNGLEGTLKVTQFQLPNGSEWSLWAATSDTVCLNTSLVPSSASCFLIACIRMQLYNYLLFHLVKRS